MSETFAPGTSVVVATEEDSVPGTIPAVVVADDGSDTVVVRFAHPHLDRETTAVPVLRRFLTARESPE
jgi:hypothetical protein